MCTKCKFSERTALQILGKSQALPPKVGYTALRRIYWCEECEAWHLTSQRYRIHRSKDADRQ
jgi:hypothetical protein